MPRPLVIAHHLIFTIYGVWLPNDPRGSSSHKIRNEWIVDLGELHHGRKIQRPTVENDAEADEEYALLLRWLGG